MKKTNLILAAAAALLPAVFLACAAGKNSYVSPRLESGARPGRTVAVLPGRIEITCEKTAGDGDCADMTTDVAAALEEALAEALSLHGFEVVNNPAFLDRLYSDPEEGDLYYCLTDMLLPEAAPGPGAELQGFGPEAARMAADAGADGLGLIVARGEVHSAGQRTLALTADVLVGVITSAACLFSPICVVSYTNFFGDTQNRLFWRVAVADGADGEVLLKLWGSASLDDFVLAAAPGKERYPERMEELKAGLAAAIGEALDQALLGEEE